MASASGPALGAYQGKMPFGASATAVCTEVKSAASPACSRWPAKFPATPNPKIACRSGRGNGVAGMRWSVRPGAGRSPAQAAGRLARLMGSVGWPAQAATSTWPAPPSSTSKAAGCATRMGSLTTSSSVESAANHATRARPAALAA